MTVVKKNIIRSVRDITIGSSLIIALAGGMVGCNSEEEADYEVAEVYTKGVKTYIKEVGKDEFKIIDEREVPIDSAVAIVSYLNGKQDTLNPTMAKKLVDNDLQDNNRHYHHRSSLSSVLLHGGMGYMFASMMGRNNNQYYTARHQYQQENKSGNSGFYSSPKVYENSQSVQQNVGRSKTIVSRPSGSRSGFFRGSVRSSHIG